MIEKTRTYSFLLGIGGIGMSGIAEILRLQGYAVSGCDLCKTGKTVDYLKK